MLCSALTTNGNPCSKSHTSGCTITGVDGWVYYLCTQHHKMHEAGKTLDLDKNPARGHAPDQPQLDMNNPVQNAWATKEKNVITTEQIASMPDVTEFVFPEFKVMVTGHRANAFTDSDLANLEGLLDRFFNTLKPMHPEEMVIAISGGADGADRAYARAAVRNHVPFDLYLPHEGYGPNYFGTSSWFRNMVNAARTVRYSSTAAEFHWSMNFKRNIDMIETADLHVVITNQAIENLLKARRGGTSHAVKEMKARGVERVVKINPRRNTITWVTL